MKNIFIAGVARSGKSTLAKILQKNGDYNHIPLDYFVSPLRHNFPSTNISATEKLGITFIDTGTKGMSQIVEELKERGVILN